MLTYSGSEADIKMQTEVFTKALRKLQPRMFLFEQSVGITDWKAEWAAMQRRVAACGYLTRFEVVKAGECGAGAGRERVIGCGVRLA